MTPRQIYRFTENELNGIVPYSQLARYYDELQDEIGVSGQSDDLSDYFKYVPSLLPAIRPGQPGQRLIAKYNRHKSHFNRNGIRMGLPHLAVLSQDHGSRKAFDYANLEFFQPWNQAIYSPAYTIDRLIRERAVEYRGGQLVTHAEEHSDGVIVHTKDLTTGELRTFKGERVLVGLGTINTARFALESRKDYSSQLPLLDNLISYIPLLDIFALGNKLCTEGLSIQSSLVYEGQHADGPIMGTFYKTSGVLRTDLLFDFPFSLRTNIEAASKVLPALHVLQIWYPDIPRKENFIKLSPDGSVQVTYQDRERTQVERHIIRTFLRSGMFGHLRLCKFPAPGNSFHYAGTLSGAFSPHYRCDSRGVLEGFKRLHIIDASTFSSLPSKNLSFTIMANAARIADSALNS